MARFVVALLGALVLAALLAGPAQARMERSLLPGAVQRSTTALLQPSNKLKQCAGDLWFGVTDSAKDTASIVKSCVTEQADLVRFWWEDVQKLGAAVAADLRAAAGKCPQSGASGCVKLVLGVAARQLKPVALLFGEGLRLWIRLGYSGLLEILGCSMLPAFLPFVWNTLLDLIIFGQCLLQ